MTVLDKFIETLQTADHKLTACFINKTAKLPCNYCIYSESYMHTLVCNKEEDQTCENGIQQYIEQEYSEVE